MTTTAGRARTRTLHAAVCLVAAAVLVGACSSGGSGSPRGADGIDSGSRGVASMPTGPYTGSDFATPPSPLPRGAHGTLLRYEPTRSRAGATTYRILYLSTAVDGSPVAVSGLALVPKTPAPSGGRRVLALAHGTTGLGDSCAPSASSDGGEIDLMGPWVRAGYLVAATDYEGLGTPGVHPYLVGESEGRSVLDAVLASRSLPGADAGTSVAIAGYSQGGHASLWANQIAATWTPSLHVVGDFAGAPASELEVIGQVAASNRVAGGFFMYVVAGFAAAYPQAKPSELLTTTGTRLLAAAKTQCVAPFLATAARANAPLFKANAADTPPWNRLLRRNDPGQSKTADPILIVHSSSDDVVPPAFSQHVFKQLCSLGQVVDRRLLDHGQGHVQAAPEAYEVAFAWIQDRFAGTPASSTCAAGEHPPA